MGDLQSLEEVAHLASEVHDDLCVQLGVAVFEDDPDVDVVLVVRAGQAFCLYVVDDEFGGRYLETSKRMVVAIFTSVSGLAVMVMQPPAMACEFDDICEMREGSTWWRHVKTAVGSEELIEGFCSTLRCM